MFFHEVRMGAYWAYTHRSSIGDVLVGEVERGHCRLCTERRTPHPAMEFAIEELKAQGSHLKKEFYSNEESE
ncbi:MAP3K12-binding inhibitory protein 1 [Caligus rogercresseyi]|uniref:MAP3K12-binding inhibitory protein 1 n=1 Tax=Caligus rogercresseyi TaxID=217165 RepID=A0A7T8QTB6_CALRO|nr:MAP3K12-binding inhibitory protein 1 [Caligus rogercresseyi]